MEPAKKKRKPRAKKVKVVEAPAPVIPETLPEAVTEVLTEGPEGIVWLPILVAVLVAFTISGGAYWYLQQSKTLTQTVPDVQIPVQTEQSSTNSNTQTYTNAEYGFSVQYPNNIPPDDPMPGTPSAYDYALVSFTAAEPGLVGAKLFVGATASLIDPSAENCLIAPASVETSTYDIATSTINDVSFITYKRSSASSGYEWYARYYRTLHNGKCFSIVEQLSAGKENAEQDSIQAFASFDPIIQSFRFTN